jgi:hypothetical protein
MTDPCHTAHAYKDRTVGLVVFGSVSILIGVCCLLLISLMFLSVALSKTAGVGSVDLRSAFAASAMYGCMAVAFVWLGVGSIRARRWACQLLLSLSWIWLLTGVCSVVVGMLVVPAVVGQLGAQSDLPPELGWIVILVTFGVIGLLYVVLPGLFVLFYRSPHVAATCRARHPGPEWIDGCPRQLLTLTVVWVLLAVSILLMPAYDFFFPFFGVALTGIAGALPWALVLVICGALAVGSCRRAGWAWWGGLFLTLAGTVSSIVTVLRYDLSEIVALMKLPEDQVELIRAMPVFDGWLLALTTAVVSGTFLIYLFALRRFFDSGPVEQNG